MTLWSTRTLALVSRRRTMNPNSSTQALATERWPPTARWRRWSKSSNNENFRSRSMSKLSRLTAVLIGVYSLPDIDAGLGLITCGLCVVCHATRRSAQPRSGVVRGKPESRPVQWVLCRRRQWRVVQSKRKTWDVRRREVPWIVIRKTIFEARKHEAWVTAQVLSQIVMWLMVRCAEENLHATRRTVYLSSPSPSLKRESLLQVSEKRVKKHLTFAHCSPLMSPPELLQYIQLFPDA